MSAAAFAYRVLREAMLEERPTCMGDPRDSELAEKCAVCGLRSACRAYAQIERPHGFWGGQRWIRRYQRAADDDG